MNYNKLRFGEIIDNEWGLIDILDENNKPTNYIAIRRPIQDYNKLDELLKTKKLIGLSAYQNFPQPMKNEYDSQYSKTEILLKYYNKIILWCHCFKDPSNYIMSGIPLLFQSDSDHYNNSYLINKAINEKKYDFFCSLPDGDWNTWIRGVEVAKKWLNYMADEMKLKILVGGGNRREGFSNNIEFTGFLGWSLFIDKMNSCKYLFNASRYDASPRIIIEALSLNIPILLNQDILGGWKYINKSTGMLFFYDEPIKTTVTKFLENKYEPRKWMQLNFNFNKSQEILANTLNKIISMKYEDFIDGIMFINLENRKDRLELINNEFKNAEIPESLIHRIDAVLDSTCGHLGCTKSHIKALEYAKEKKWDRFLILEDDFIFNLPKERILYILSEFFKKFNWNVFMFTTYWNEVTNTETDFIKKINYGTTTAGYLVNSSYLDTLLNNFNESMKILSNEVEQFKISNPNQKKYTSGYALDQYWKSLQQKDNFYISEPYIGKQSYDTPSTIMS
jgi:glycosyl transferase family 25